MPNVTNVMLSTDVFRANKRTQKAPRKVHSHRAENVFIKYFNSKVLEILNASVFKIRCTIVLLLCCMIRIQICKGTM